MFMMFMSVNKKHKNQDGEDFKLHMLKEAVEYINDGFY